MDVGQHRPWWWKEETLKIYFNLPPWVFPQLYPGHLEFWPMRKTNTAMITKYCAKFLSLALKRPNVGSRSPKTPVLFLINLTLSPLSTTIVVLFCFIIRLNHWELNESLKWVGLHYSLSKHCWCTMQWHAYAAWSTSRSGVHRNVYTMVQWSITTQLL